MTVPQWQKVAQATDTFDKHFIAINTLMYTCSAVACVCLWKPFACCWSRSAAEVEHSSCLWAQLCDMTEHCQVKTVLEVKPVICMMSHTVNPGCDICCCHACTVVAEACPACWQGWPPHRACWGTVLCSFCTFTPAIPLSFWQSHKA